MRVRHAEHVMGTVVSFDVPERVPLTPVLAWLHWVDARFSPYRAGSDVSRLARRELTLEECVPEMSHVVQMCSELSRKTSGYFTAHAGGRFDPCGYVKGWAIERACDMLTEAGSANHIVNGGGDIQCQGERAPGRPWRLGIADPLRRGLLACVVTAPPGGFAIATSGPAERGVHIVDPIAGRTAAGLASITITGPRLALTDAYATAAFAMGPAARDWVESLDGYEAFAVTADGDAGGPAECAGWPERGASPAAAPPMSTPSGVHHVTRPAARSQRLSAGPGPAPRLRRSTGPSPHLLQPAAGSRSLIICGSTRTGTRWTCCCR